MLQSSSSERYDRPKYLIGIRGRNHQPEVWTNPRGIVGVNLKNEIPRMHPEGGKCSMGVNLAHLVNLPTLWTRGKWTESWVNDDVVIKIACKNFKCITDTYY